MSRHRCRAPECGRFVSAAGGACARHASPPDTATLDPEINAVRTVLADVLNEVGDVQERAKLVPRIVSVSIQAIKTSRHLGDRESTELMRLLGRISDDIERST